MYMYKYLSLHVKAHRLQEKVDDNEFYRRSKMKEFQNSFRCGELSFVAKVASTKPI